MALVIADRVKETTTTTSTGAYTLAGATLGFQSFAAVGNGNTTYYVCTDNTDFEVGIGTFTASGTTLSRDTILESSNSDNPVDWSAGSKDVFVTVPAEKYLVRDASGNVSLTGNLTISGTVDGRDVSADGTKLDGIEASADVTDGTNVAAAGALMDSEVTNLAQVKAFDSSDYATAAQGSTADAALPKAGGTMTGNVSFGDNNKIIMGSGSDLQLFHDGTNSFVKDAAAGDLILDTNGDSVRITHSANGETMARFQKNNKVELYYDNAVSLSTTSTGIETGSITADALNVSAASPNIDVTDTGTSHASQDFLTNSNAVRATIGVERSAGGGLFVGSSAYAAVFGTASAGNTEFATANNVRMTIDTSGHAIIPAGVTLGTSVGVYAAANTLDDYEEGTWTPTLGGNTTYSIQSGTYVKVGRLVSVQAVVSVTTLGTGSTTTLSGLPFTCSNAGGGNMGGGVFYFAGLAVNVITPTTYFGNSTISVAFKSNTSAGTGISGNLAIFGNSARVDFSLTYETTA